jgi:hypothetical protein
MQSDLSIDFEVIAVFCHCEGQPHVAHALMFSQRKMWDLPICEGDDGGSREMPVMEPEPSIGRA